MLGTNLSFKTVLLVYRRYSPYPDWSTFVINSMLKHCNVVTIVLGNGYYLIDLLKKPSLIPRAIARTFDRKLRLPAEVNPDLVLVLEPLGYSSISLDFSCPKAIWVADSIFWRDSYHWQPSEVADVFDYIFVASKPGIELYSHLGADKVEFLPMGCEPSIHKHHDVATDFDISFIGSPEAERDELLHALQARFKTFVGRQIYTHDLALAYCRAKVAFNKHARLFPGPNSRVFEALACRKLLLTDSFPGCNEMFVDGKHLVIYSDKKDLFEKVAYYLGANEERESIASTGQLEVYSHHSFDARVKKILETMRMM